MLKNKIDFGKFKTVLLYQFWYQWVGLAIFTGIVATFVILNAVGVPLNMAYDIAIAVVVLTIGIQVQSSLFRYCLFNGTSRRTYFFASVIAVIGFSLLMALVGSIAAVITPEMAIFDQVYNYGFFALLLWNFTLCLMAAFLGWFIKVVFDALSKNWRYILMGCIFAFSIILVLFNFFVIDDMFLRVLLFVFWNHGPFFAMMWFTILGLGFGFGTWLIIRRIQV